MGGKPSSVGFPGITMKREPINRIFEKLTLVKRKKEKFAKNRFLNRIWRKELLFPIGNFYYVQNVSRRTAWS